MSRESVETYVQSTTPCPSCAAKDAEIERLRTEFGDLMESFRELGMEALPDGIQRILRGEG